MSDDIETMIRAAIQTKVIEAFNTTPEMVEKLVRAAFEKEVNEYGGKPEYRDKDKMPWLEWLVGEEIRKAAKEAVHEYMEVNRDAVKAKVIASLNNGDLGSQIGEKVADLMSQEYNWSFNVEAKRS